MYALRKLAVISVASVAMTCAFAQSEPQQTDSGQRNTQQSDQRMNETDKSAPQAASSPHQRKATSTTAAEAPANTDAEPTSSSSPHQRQSTKTATGGPSEEMLNNCISKHQKANANLSKDQAKRTCMDQMKNAETPAG
jgi:hypothetical protein